MVGTSSKRFAIDVVASRGRVFGLGPSFRASGGEVGAAATYIVVNGVKFCVEVL